MVTKKSQKDKKKKRQTKIKKTQNTDRCSIYHFIVIACVIGVITMNLLSHLSS